MAEFNKIKGLLEKVEGNKSHVYDDNAKDPNPTIGIGSNLNSPEVRPYFEDRGVDFEKLKSGEEGLEPDQVDDLLMYQLHDKEKHFNNIQKQDFPNADINEDEKTALMSMYFNSPKLIGPNMRKHLEANQDDDVAKEILLRSNKHKNSGIQKRRLLEAREYLGSDKRFNELANNLTNEELTEIANLINQIGNKHERQQVLEEYPFLKPFVKPTFNKILGE